MSRQGERGREHPGRRVAVRPSRIGAGTAVAAAVLPVVFGALAWAGSLLQPGVDAPTVVRPGGQVRVDDTVLVCPAVAERGAVAIARPDLDADQPAAAQVTVGGADEGGSAVDLPLGQLVRPPSPTDPALVRAEGPAAPGLYAEAVRVDGPRLSVVPCAGPATSWWFAGAGSGLRHRTALALTNPGQGPAVVDVRLHGVEGRVDADSLRGVTLPPGTTRLWSWADVVPGQDLLAVEVRAVRGAVVATATDETGGRGWTSGGTTPATTQLVPAVPTGPGRVLVSVVNPGDAPLRARVRVVAQSGAFVPVDREELTLAPGAVAALDLTAAVDGRPAAVEVTADEPVVAGVRKVVRTADDSATVPAVAALEQPGAAGVGPGPSVLHLSSGDEAGRVRVRAVGADGELVAEEQIGVPSASLVTWRVPAGTAYVVVEPTRGAPYAAVERRVPAGGAAVVPVLPLPWELTVPDVLAQSDS